jgi:hypothetical protein
MTQKRLHYYDQQFLMEPDFTDEQTYHVGMRRKLNSLLHTSGIAQHLEVVKAGDRIVTVKTGAAIDSMGREIVLDADQNVNLDDPVYPPTMFPPKGNVVITIAYSESIDKPIAPAPQGARWTETAVVTAATALPKPTDPPCVVLASFQLDDQGHVPAGPPDGGVRIPAGAFVAPATVSDSSLVPPLLDKVNLVLGALQVSQYDLRVRSRVYVTFSNKDADGAVRSLGLSFQPRLVLVLGLWVLNTVDAHECNSTSVGFFDGSNQTCVGWEWDAWKGDTGGFYDHLWTGDSRFDAVGSAFFKDETDGQQWVDDLAVYVARAQDGTWNAKLSRGHPYGTGPIASWACSLYLYCMGT